jgi:hypothetical protein
MDSSARPPASPRRDFLADVAHAGAALALGACATSPGASTPSTGGAASARAPWDVAWLDRVRRARHRALFDGPSGDVALMLAARYLDNVAAVYGAAAPEVVAVVNLRTRAVHLALSDEAWRKYPIGEDANAKDAAGAPARRNPSLRPEPGASEPAAGIGHLRDDRRAERGLRLRPRLRRPSP